MVPGLAPAWEIYLIPFPTPSFKTPNTMIRIAWMEWEEGRLKREEAKEIPPVLPPSVFLIYTGLVYRLMNEEFAL